MLAAIDTDEKREQDRVAEWALVEACRAGDERALETLYRTHVRSVERTVGRILGATPDLEDLVQQTFVEALRALDRFQGIAGLRTWLTRIAVHTVTHYLRAGRIRRTTPLELVADEELQGEEPALDRVLDERRLSPVLHGLLDKLSAKKRVAFVLFAIEGLSASEVATLMGASETATRSRVFFARRELRQLVNAHPQLSALVADLFERQGGAA